MATLHLICADTVLLQMAALVHSTKDMSYTQRDENDVMPTFFAFFFPFYLHLAFFFQCLQYICLGWSDGGDAS